MTNSSSTASPSLAPSLEQNPAADPQFPATTRLAIEGVPRTKHLDSLDGLRGIAVLLVLGIHLGFLGIGWAGVDVFFVLSGFLITGVLMAAKKKAKYFRNFYARRALRTFPIYYGLCILVFGITLPLFHFPRSEGLRADAPWIFIYMTNFLGIIPHTVPPGLFSHFWSLAVEEHFYLVWPLLVYLLPRRPLVVVCCVIIFVALVTRLIMQHFDASSDAIFNVTFCRMDGLATGALIACLDTDRVGHLIVRFRWLALAMIASVMTILCYFNGSTDGHGHVIEGVGFTIVALCSAVILLLAIQSAKDSWFGRFFRAGILRFFGRYSYGIYAIHPFVLYICWLMLGPEKIKSHISSHFLQENTFRFVAFPIFVGLAVLSFELYEKQFLKLKKFFQ